MAFKTYCNTVLGDETAGQSRLDMTGQPDEFASGTNKMSRLEQLMQQRQKAAQGKKDGKSMMDEFLGDNTDRPLMKTN